MFTLFFAPNIQCAKNGLSLMILLISKQAATIMIDTSKDEVASITGIGWSLNNVKMDKEVGSKNV